LLADQGPAIAIVPKLKKQIDRMTKLRDEFLQKKQADVQGRLPDAPAGPLLRREEQTQPAEFQRTDQGRPPAAPAQTVGGSMPPNRRSPRAAQSSASIVVSEVLPAWGPLKRFEFGCFGMDRATYDHSVDCARWTFDHMKANSGGPRRLLANNAG
jgi:hypothetical protein